MGRGDLTTRCGKEQHLTWELFARLSTEYMRFLPVVRHRFGRLLTSAALNAALYPTPPSEAPSLESSCLDPNAQ